MNDIALGSGSLGLSSRLAAPTAAKWVGRVTGGIAIAFLTFDTVIKVCSLPVAVEASNKMGFPPGFTNTMGFIELALIVLYLVPRTAPIGAVLWTGYLGGAIATHAKLGDPLFSHTLFPIYVAVLMWLPLYLRDPRVRALVGR